METILNECGNKRCSINRTALCRLSKVTVRRCRVRPWTVTFKSLLDPDFDRPDLDLDFSEAWMLTQPSQVRVFDQPFEVAVTLVDCLIQGIGCLFKALGEGVAASEVVKHGRIA